MLSYVRGAWGALTVKNLPENTKMVPFGTCFQIDPNERYPDRVGWQGQFFRVFVVI